MRMSKEEIEIIEKIQEVAICVVELKKENESLIRENNFLKQLLLKKEVINE